MKPLMEEPDISIIIRAKDHSIILKRTLSSIEKQRTSKTFEILIVTDQGHSRSFQSLHESKLQIQIIEYPRKFSFGGTLNFGAEKARGRVIVNLSDHSPPLGKFWLEKLTSPLFTTPRVVATFGRQIPIEGVNPFEEREHRLTYGKKKFRTMKFYFSNANSAVRKTIWEKIRFNEDIPAAEDHLFFKQVKEKVPNCQIQYVKEAIVFHSHPVDLKRVFRVSLITGYGYRYIYSPLADDGAWNILACFLRLVGNIFLDLVYITRKKYFWAYKKIFPYRFLQIFGYRAGYKRINKLDFHFTLNHMSGIDFSDHGSSEINEKIYHDLNLIVSAIRANFEKSIRSIILVGGFSRGEGSVIVQENIIRPLNDYDLLIVNESQFQPLKKIHSLSTKLACFLDIDFVDLAFHSPAVLQKFGFTMENYDIKETGLVLWGQNVIPHLPKFRAEKMPLWEILRLNFNRMIGLLEKTEYDSSTQGFCVMDKAYFFRQITKLVLAWVDTVNFINGQYHSSYREKYRCFQQVSARHKKTMEILGDQDFQELIKNAVDFKIRPDNRLWKDWEISATFKKTQDYARKIFRLLFRKETGKPTDSISGLEIIRHFHSIYARSSGKVTISKVKRLLPLILNRQFYYRQLVGFLKENFRMHIFFTIPLLFFGVQDSGEFDTQFYDAIQKQNKNIFAVSEFKGNWNALRTKVYMLWNLLCH